MRSPGAEDIVKHFLQQYHGYKESLRKSTVAKCLRAKLYNPYNNGLKTSTGLIAPLHMSQHVCVCVYVCVYTPPTCSNLRRPGKQKEPCRGLGIWYSQIPDTGFLKHSRSRQRQPPGEPCWGILEQYQSRRCLKEEGSWSGVSLIHSFPKRLHPKVQSEKKELRLQRIAFQKPVFIVEPARCHVNLTSVPTHAENHPSAHKGEYISILEHGETQRNYRTVANKNTSLFLLCLPLTSLCFSHGQERPKKRKQEVFSPQTASDHKDRGALRR